MERSEGAAWPQAVAHIHIPVAGTLARSPVKAAP